MHKTDEITAAIKAKSSQLGFLKCGISKAEFLEEEAPRLEKWLKQGFHGEMDYMENNFDKRLNPQLLVPGAKSVISLLYNYFPEKQQPENTFKLAKYAYGKDYHFVIKDKLKEFFHWMYEEIGTVEGRVFVDSAPVLEKAWAAKSGIGWIGKNSNLLTRQIGSYYFLAEIILDLELKYDGMVTDHCGSCTACLDACPTQAIESPRIVNGSKCISYATIELKSELPGFFKDKMEDWMFGCDICQDVCPWNRFSTPHSEPQFIPHPAVQQFSKKEWKELTQEVFNEIFRNSAVKRAKYSGLKRNIEMLTRD